MCSAFVDSLTGQLKHISQRTGFALVAGSDVARLEQLQADRGWNDVPWVSAADNTSPVDFQSEMPNGAQVPSCNVFVRREGKLHHFWNSEMFFALSEFHPRHVDMLWPL
jgi:predicted dithiol-disulfide oxidoreductase (DUF899 family)